jgi:parallel beta-helix repeat protein
MERVEKITVALIVVTIISFFAGINSARAKSVYAITEHDASTLKAYKILGNQLQEQANVYASYDYAGGITIDSNLELLFITYEGSAKIVWASSKSLEQKGFIDLHDWYSSAGELAGIVADEANQRIYVVQRYSNKLYILAWNASQKKLILMNPRNPTQPYSEGYPYVSLVGLYNNWAWGIALDENTRRLYVTDNTNNVHIYDADDINWTYLGPRDVGREAMGIAVNPNNGQHPAYLYVGGFMVPGGGFHTFLVKHNLEAQTNPNTEQNIETVATGLAVDVDTGLVYVTTTDWKVRVYDCSGYPFICTYSVDTGGTLKGPAGVCVPIGDFGYKPDKLYLSKSDSVAEGDCVSSGQEFTYFIEYSGNGFGDTSVVITDTLPPEVTYISSSDEGYYNAENHTVTWSFPSIGPEDGDTLQIQVELTCYAKPGSIITNVVEMEGDTSYSKQTLGTKVCCGGDIIYVDKDATGCNNGTSWNNAYIDLQDALTNAANCSPGVTEIRVAEGTYKPTTNVLDASATFQLVNGVAVKGGYAGVGTPDPDARDIEAYPTILTGNIDDIGDGDVVFVVTAESDINSSSTILDGFTINKGSQIGIYCDGGSPTISNNIIQENKYYGIYCINNSSPEIKDCLIQENGDFLYYYTAGIGCESSVLLVSRCTIKENNGCGIYYYMYDGLEIPAEIKNNWIYDNVTGIYIIDYSGPSYPVKIRNNTIVYNNVYGIYFLLGTEPEVVNCILYYNTTQIGTFSGHELGNVNYCCVQGDTFYPGNGNIKTPPLFLDADAGDYHLTKYSGCVDTGNSYSIPLKENDIDGNPRVAGMDVDIGGDEDFKHCFPEYEYIYNDWVDPLGRPNCWLERYQCDGDADNLTQGILKYRVYTNDFNIMVANWKKLITDKDFNPCADFDQKPQGVLKFRVYTNDFNILVGNWKKTDAQLPGDCYRCESYKQSLGKTLTSQEIMKWFEQLWLDEEVQKLIDKDVLLKFIESLKEEL